MERMQPVTQPKASRNACLPFLVFSFQRSIWTRSVHISVDRESRWLSRLLQTISPISNREERKVHDESLDLHISPATYNLRGRSTDGHRSRTSFTNLPVCVWVRVCVHGERVGWGTRDRCVPKRQRKSPSIEF
jgi:hypothetical protein